MVSVRKSLIVTTALAACLVVAACGGQQNVRKQLGLVGVGPDEFTVVKRKPLTMPSGFDGDALPEPKPGAPNLVDPRPVEDAQRALQGDSLVAAATPSSAEVDFVRAAGAQDADDSVRAELLEGDDEPELILNRLLGKREALERADELDASEEADRIAREAQATKNPGLEIPSETKAADE